MRTRHGKVFGTAVRVFPRNGFTIAIAWNFIMLRIQSATSDPSVHVPAMAHGGTRQFFHGHSCAPPAPDIGKPTSAASFMLQSSLHCLPDGARFAHVPELTTQDIAPQALVRHGQFMPDGHEAGVLILNARSRRPLAVDVALRRVPGTQDRAVVDMRGGAVEVKKAPSENGHVWMFVSEHGLRGGTRTSTEDIQKLLDAALDNSHAADVGDVMQIDMPDGSPDARLPLAGMGRSLRKANDVAFARHTIAVALSRLRDIPGRNMKVHLDGRRQIHTGLVIDKKSYRLRVECDPTNKVTYFQITKRLEENVACSFRDTVLPENDVFIFSDEDGGSPDPSALVGNSGGTQGVKHPPGSSLILPPAQKIKVTETIPATIDELLQIGRHETFRRNDGEAVQFLPVNMPCGGGAARFPILDMRRSLQNADDVALARRLVANALKNLSTLSEGFAKNVEGGGRRLHIPKLTDNNTQYRVLMVCDQADMVTYFSITKAIKGNTIEKKNFPVTVQSESRVFFLKDHDAESSKLIANLASHFGPDHERQQFMCYLALFHDALPSEILELSANDYDIETATFTLRDRTRIALDAPARKAFWQFAADRSKFPLNVSMFHAPLQSEESFKATLTQLAALPQFADLSRRDFGRTRSSVLEAGQRVAIRRAATSKHILREASNVRGRLVGISRLASTYGFQKKTGGVDKLSDELDEHSAVKNSLAGYSAAKDFLAKAIAGSCVLAFPHHGSKDSVCCTSVITTPGGASAPIRLRADFKDGMVDIFKPVFAAPFDADADMESLWEKQADLITLKKAVDWQGKTANLVRLGINPEQGESLSPPVSNVARYRSVILESGKEVTLYARVIGNKIVAASDTLEGLPAIHGGAASSFSISTPEARLPRPGHETWIAAMNSNPNRPCYVHDKFATGGTARVSMENIKLVHPHASLQGRFVYMGKSFHEQTLGVYENSAAAEAIIRAFIETFPAIALPKGGELASVSHQVTHDNVTYDVSCRLSHSGEITGVCIGGLARRSDNLILANALMKSIVDDEHALTYANQDRLLVFLYIRWKIGDETFANFTHEDVDERGKIRIGEKALDLGDASFLLRDHLGDPRTVANKTYGLFRKTRNWRIASGEWDAFRKNQIATLDEVALGTAMARGKRKK
jgi:hypothetical protein